MAEKKQSSPFHSLPLPEMAGNPTRFILNNTDVSSNDPPGTPLLDFIRYHESLTGTRCGCREGDCGACLVLIGEPVLSGMKYLAVPSCLTPLGQVHGKHIVTIEGLTTGSLTPVQRVMAECGATQCGFCSPGFVIAITAAFLEEAPNREKIMQAIDGNICRCTGYKSIERAVDKLMQAGSACGHDSHLEWLIHHQFIPEWFTSVPIRLKNIRSRPFPGKETILVAGGTDLLVQRPGLIREASLTMASHLVKDTIEISDGVCTLGAGITATGIMQSEALRTVIPSLERYFLLIASTPVRNRGTLGGNIANASPIADLVIFFMALEATVICSSSGHEKREIPLCDFFTGYKTTRLSELEVIHEIRFPVPGRNTLFNFEKVSKREHLDIASVNSALFLTMNNGIIEKAVLTAGGVAPVPLLFKQTSEFLKGRKPGVAVLNEANRIAQEEITPISDIRGSISYKRLLVRQLLTAHFFTFFPDSFSSGQVVPKLNFHDPR
jgi:xanthine dehydrogenase small subunit